MVAIYMMGNGSGEEMKSDPILHNLKVGLTAIAEGFDVVQMKERHQV